MGLFSKSNKKVTEAISEFKCPYCFETIAHDKVHFLIKAATAVEYYSDEELSYMSEDDRDRYKRRQEEVKPFLVREKDEQLDEFWNEVGGKDAYSFRRYEDNELQWDCPVVYPATAETMTLNGYERDEDGFVTAVTDSYSKHRSEVRLCPHCHNPLPKFYGKYPMHFISIVGIRESGKTVYLHQLISGLTKYLGEIGIDKYLSDDEADKFYKIDATDRFLPTGTTVDTIQAPITVTIKRGSKFDTLVFFDISGENCIDPQRMAKYGAFISNSDGIIMLIDPVQFPEIAANINEERKEDVTSVLTAMRESFLTNRLDSEGKVNTPFAFVISKSDYLVNELVRNPKWRRSLLLDNVKPKDRKVNWGDIILVNKNVREIVDEFAPAAFLTSTIKDGFGNYTFLAVSSLGCGTRKVFSNFGSRVKGDYVFNTVDLKKADTVIIPVNETEEKNLTNHIEKYDLIPDENKTRFISYNPVSGLTLDVPGLSEEAYKSHNTIQFEIDTAKKAVYEMYYDTDSGEWKQGVKFGIEKLPAYVPQPKRIEEPLHWMLVKLGLAEKAQQQ